MRNQFQRKNHLKSERFWKLMNLLLPCLYPVQNCTTYMKPLLRYFYSILSNSIYIKSNMCNVIGLVWVLQIFIGCWTFLTYTDPLLWLFSSLLPLKKCNMFSGWNVVTNISKKNKSTQIPIPNVKITKAVMQVEIPSGFPL